MAALAGVGACDAGKQADQQTKGPLIRITDVSVGADKPLPADGEIQIAVDRYLLPSSVTRQSVFVVTAGGDAADNELITRYDPVSRTLSVRGLKDVWLTPGQPYKLQFSLPPNEEVNDRGLRAIDRATLDPNQPREFAFFAAEPTGQKNEKPIDFCGDVMPILTLRCTVGVCHASRTDKERAEAFGGAAAGLVLDSFTGIQTTAIGRVANGANTSGRSGNPEERARVFGVGMPLIDPFEPGNSWLLYKIELARGPTVDAGPQPAFECNTAPDVAVVAARTDDPFRFNVKVQDPSDLERAVLSDYVPGREMPYPPEAIETPTQQPLSFDERQRLRLWIAQGAVLKLCGGCSQPLAVPDAGTPDGGTNDAGDAGVDASDASTDAQDQ